jgi:predicted dehydrogenase
MVDLMQLFIGKITEVNSFITNNFWKYNVEDNAYAIMKNKEDVVCMLHSSATQWRHRFELDINFEKGNLILSGILSSSKSYGFESLTIIKADPTKDNGSPKEEKILFYEDKSWEMEINEFTKSIVNDKKISSGNSQDALNTIKTIYAIYYADKKWRQKFSIPKP